MTIREHRAMDWEVALAREWKLSAIASRPDWKAGDIVIIRTSLRQYVRKARIVSVNGTVAQILLLNRKFGDYSHARENGKKGGRPKLDMKKLDMSVPEGCRVVRNGSYYDIEDSVTNQVHHFRSGRQLLEFARRM